jgi:hypothetical protein
MADDASLKPRRAKKPEGDTTPEKHLPAALEANKWQPGQTGNPAGRPKGSRNKLGEAFIQAMYEDFQEHGPDVIEKVREEKPDQYLKVVASILPQQLNVRVSEFDELTEEQIDQRINAIARALQLEAGAIAASGREAAPQAGKPLN